MHDFELEEARPPCKFRLSLAHALGLTLILMLTPVRIHNLEAQPTMKLQGFIFNA